MLNTSVFYTNNANLNWHQQHVPHVPGSTSLRVLEQQYCKNHYYNIKKSSLKMEYKCSDLQKILSSQLSYQFLLLDFIIERRCLIGLCWSVRTRDTQGIHRCSSKHIERAHAHAHDSWIFDPSRDVYGKQMSQWLNLCLYKLLNHMTMNHWHHTQIHFILKSTCDLLS